MDYEIIIVDDGSTDDSREVVKQYGEKIRYIWQNNQGLAGARNTGIRKAKGDLVALLDSDDEWLPNYLEQMVALSEKYPDAQVYYCMAQCMDVDGRDLPQIVGGPPVDPENLHHVLLRANFIIPSTVMLRRKTIVEAGIFDINLRSCEDWDLWLRLLPTGKIVGASNKLVRYRVHASSLSTNVEGMQNASRKVIEKHFGTDDGDPASWQLEKRRAFGGVYRYQCITYVQRQNNWDACLLPMQKALQTDPSLAIDLDFFYELGLGSQQVGYRGVSDVQDQEGNVLRLEKCVHALPNTPDMSSVRNQAIGTSEYALGLITYGSGRRSASRRFFFKAIVYRPGLLFDIRLISNYFKSFIHRDGLESLKRLLRRTS